MSDFLRDVELSVARSPSFQRAVKAAGLGKAFRRFHSRVRRHSANLEHANLGLLMNISLTSDSNCVDVGASHGLVLADMVRLSPTGKHIAFEPIPDLYENLVARYPTVDVRCVALSDEQGEAAFNWLPHEDGYSGLVKTKYGPTPEGQRISVRTERLDEQLPAGYEPTFIKIDVEGGELGVLQGAYETLAKHRPMVVIEYPARPEPGITRDDLFHLLVGRLGYRAFDLVGNGPFSRQQFAKSSSLNFVFHD